MSCSDQFDWIFQDSNGRKYTRADIIDALRVVGADQCKSLFVHTDIMFGMPNAQLKRSGYLQVLWEILQSLKVDTLFFPAFSYSFNNHEDYDVRNTRTTMGALIEYIRKQPNVVRSMDPMVSIIGFGKEANLLCGNPGENAFGIGSGFDKLHHLDDLKFLFFGADFSGYFTYIHHLEKVAQVPYRYDQAFSGHIVDYGGNREFHTHIINTQCGKVKLKNFATLKQELIQDGSLRCMPLGNLEVACIAEHDIYQKVMQCLHDNPYSFVEPYSVDDLTHEYTFGKNGERVTHC